MSDPDLTPKVLEVFGIDGTSEIYSAYLKNGNTEPVWFYFGDIDISGFRIFIRLRENIAINAIPHMMDRNTLISNIGKAQKVDDSYLKELEKLLEDNAFSIFHETIKTMIEYRVRLLEQENLI